MNHDYEIEKQAHPENFERDDCDCEDGVICNDCSDENCTCPNHKSPDFPHEVSV